MYLDNSVTHHPGCSCSEIFRCEASALGNASEHARADFVRVVKCKDVVRPLGTCERLMRTRFAFELPANAEERGENASGSSGWPVGHGNELGGAESDANEIGPSLGMLEAIGQDTEGERLCARDGLVARFAICKNPGEVGDLGDPAPVLFAFSLDGKMHGQNIGRSVHAC
jgi:hypothetical protein